MLFFYVPEIINMLLPYMKLAYIKQADTSDMAGQTNVPLSSYFGRNGKTGAINRGMKYVKTPIVIFSDANTILNKNYTLNDYL